MSPTINTDPVSCSACYLLPEDDAFGASPGFQELVETLRLPIIDSGKNLPDNSVAVVAGSNGLSLLSSEGARLRLDFTGGEVAHRLRTANLGEPLPKALGCGGKSAPKILDATGGFLRDAYILAGLGCDVVAVERLPVIHALGMDALSRGGEVCKRIRLLLADAKQILRKPEDFLPDCWRPDAVYLDPMFPPRKKSARPPKEAAFLQLLAGRDEDEDELLGLARQSFARVAVKRPVHAPPLAPEPACSFAGKIARFDVYLGS